MITIGNRLLNRLCNRNRIQNNYTSLDQSKKIYHKLKVLPFTRVIVHQSLGTDATVVARTAWAQVQLDFAVLACLARKAAACVCSIAAWLIDANTIVAWVFAGATVDLNGTGWPVKASYAWTGCVVQIFFAAIAFVHWWTQAAVTVDVFFLLKSNQL